MVSSQNKWPVQAPLAFHGVHSAPTCNKGRTGTADLASQTKEKGIQKPVRSRRGAGDCSPAARTKSGLDTIGLRGVKRHRRGFATSINTRGIEAYSKQMNEKQIRSECWSQMPGSQTPLFSLHKRVLAPRLLMVRSSSRVFKARPNLQRHEGEPKEMRG